MTPGGHLCTCLACAAGSPACTWPREAGPTAGSPPGKASAGRTGNLSLPSLSLSPWGEVLGIWPWCWCISEDLQLQRGDVLKLLFVFFVYFFFSFYRSAVQAAVLLQSSRLRDDSQKLGKTTECSLVAALCLSGWVPGWVGGCGRPCFGFLLFRCTKVSDPRVVGVGRWGTVGPHSISLLLCVLSVRGKVVMFVYLPMCGSIYLFIY